MDPLASLIEQEAAKLRVLEQEASLVRQRIAMLEGMRSESELDAFLTRKVASAAAPHVMQQEAIPAPPLVEQVQDVQTPQPRQWGEVKRALLGVLGHKAEHLGVIQIRAREKGYDLSDDRLRAQLWEYKTKGGLVESPKKGYYRITSAGEAYLLGKSN